MYYKIFKYLIQMCFLKFLIFLSFGVSTLCYQTYSIRGDMRIDSLAYAENENYIIAVQLLNQDYTTLGVNTLSTLPILLLKRGKTGYQVVDRIYGNKKQNTIPQNPISLSKSTGRFIVAWNDSCTRVYSFNNQLVQQIQKMEKSTSALSAISEDGNIIFVLQTPYTYSITTSATFYKWNAETKQYTSFLQKIALPNSKVAASPDLKCILNLQGSKLNIMTYNGQTYKSAIGELVGQISLNANNSTLKEISNPVRDNLRFVIIVFSQSRRENVTVGYSSTFNNVLYSKIVFCMLNGTSLAFVQTIYQYYGERRDILHLTQNGQFLAFTLLETRDILVYKYSELSNKFQLHRRYSGFVNNLKTIKISEDGNTVVGASMVGTSQTNEQFVFFVDCGIKNCELCSLQSNSCHKCKQDFIPKGNNCACESHKSLVDGRCVDCLINHCSQCLKKDVCQECGNGYSLVEGVCLCPSYKNISEINNNCVSCKVEGCVKCNVPNICSKFSDGLSGQHISYSVDVQKNLQNDEQRASMIRESVIIYKEKETPSGKEGKEDFAAKDEKEKPKEMEVVEVAQQVKKQGDKIQITLTKGEQIMGFIIMLMFLIIYALCKRCLKKRCKKKEGEELNEELPAQKKDLTNHEIASKRDSKREVMDQP